ncbi:MAG: hypothetical protein ACM3SW_02250 [Actinomycetota bacterium]
MKTSLAAILFLILSIPLAAQPRGRARFTAAHPDLQSTLLDLDRASATTLTDISHMHIERWKGGWKTGFTTSSSHKNHAEEAAGALQRNLKGPLPEMIRAALDAHGSLAPTFKVYEDLSLVCETLDTLLMVTEEYGDKKEEYVPLAMDFNNLAHLRRSLSSYIMQRASAADNGGTGGSAAAFNSYDSASTGMPRKIIIDNDPPPPVRRKTGVRKKASVRYSNQY